jgi:hypothetical protein
VVLRQRRPEAGHAVPPTRLMSHQDVRVALHEHGLAVAANGLLRPVQAEQGPALVEQRTVRAVQVLRLSGAQDPRPEAHDASRDVADGEHQASPEAVVRPPLVPPDDEARGLEHVVSEALGPRGGAQLVPGVRGVADPPLEHGLAAESPAGQVGPGLLRLRRPQPLREEAGGPRQRVQDPGAALAGLRLPAFHLVDPDPHLIGQVPDGLREAHPETLHDPADGVSALAATEAVVGPPVGADVEGGRLLVVEGAESLEPRTPSA